MEDGRGALWSPDNGLSTIFVAFDEGSKRFRFVRVNLRSSQSSLLMNIGQTNEHIAGDLVGTVSSDGRQFVYFSQDSQHDWDLWLTGADFKNPQHLTHINPQFDRYLLGAARLIEWRSADGDSLHGALLLPAGYREGKRYPLIVWVYGGEYGSDQVEKFGLLDGPFNLQLFATRGYAVLFPDSPQHLGTPMVDLAKTVLRGVDKVIEMGIADPDRLGVMGHSYGGYCVLSLIVQTKRFKAAMAADGFGDIVAAYGQMDKDGSAFHTSTAEHGQDLMGGTPWEFRDRYVENSPIFFLDRAETPLLIVHGAEDTTVSPFLGDEVFVALRRLGKEVEYAKYEGEGHSPSEWSYANQLDFCERMIAWFHNHLKRGPESPLGAPPEIKDETAPDAKPPQ